MYEPPPNIRPAFPQQRPFSFPQFQPAPIPFFQPPYMHQPPFPMIPPQYQYAHNASIKKNKGRKRKRSVPDSLEQERQRLEKNKLSARESRKKKKIYIQKLENQVNQLKYELKVCREKLSKYEEIDDLINVNCLHSYKVALEHTRKIHLKLYSQLMEKSTEIMAGMKDCISQYIVEAEERRLAIEELGRAMAEICLPPPYKYLIWAAKNNSGVYNSELKNLAGNLFDLTYIF